MLLRFLLFLARFPLVFIAAQILLAAVITTAILWKPVTRSVLQTELITIYREAFLLDQLDIQSAQKIEQRLLKKRQGSSLPEVIVNPFK